VKPPLGADARTISAALAAVIKSGSRAEKVSIDLVSGEVLAVFGAATVVISPGRTLPPRDRGKES
jgi:uncharacterized protein with ATP-grasp and redox domains